MDKAGKGGSLVPRSHAQGRAVVWRDEAGNEAEGGDDMRKEENRGEEIETYM